jgi:flagellar M-ring protein FliF
MEELRTRYAAVRQRLEALPSRARWGIGGGFLVMAAIIAFTLLRNSDPTYALLYSNLEEQDAGAVVERLRATRVPFRLENSGSQIWVPAATMYETRLTLASEGLPRGGGVGFEVFDEQRFGESEFAEQVKYHRALEGELSRTIGHLTGVESARVHLVLPQRNLFASDESQATASVVLKLRAGTRLADDRIRGVVHLVASSVRGLTPESVTVVDGEGRPLAGGEQAEEELATRSLEVRRSVEHSKEQAVQQLLDATLGVGVAIVRVAAELSFAREERTEERFNPETVATRSFQITEERDGSTGPTAAGVPGTVSNLPGGQTPTTGTAGGAGNGRRTETRNYEVSKITTRAVEPIGRVTRLDVAVVVDGTWTGTGARRRYQARTPEELTRVRTIVESAVGVQADRGDRVTVECVQFAPVPAPVSEPAASVVATFAQENWRDLALGLGVLVVLGLVIFGLRNLGKSSGGMALAGGGIGHAVGSHGGPLTVSVEAQALGGPTASEIASGASSSLPLASDIVRDDPKLAAQIVRGWLAESS